jgi:RNA 3'-terminal phosphate cyclase (ATP)
MSGATLGSQALEFRPGAVTPGDYRFAVGTAGSATLVLQTILPPLLTAGGPTTLMLEGGTHNPFAPPFDFLARSFIPQIERIGPRVALALDRPGFYPAGGGRFQARVEPAPRLAPLQLLERGAILRRRARAIVSKLPGQVGERELAVVRQQLGWSVEECAVEPVDNPLGPGNALVLEIETEHVTAVFSSFGERGRSAEQVAREATEAAAAWLDAGVPVETHLADQLLLPMALAGGGSFRTMKPSLHATTNAEMIQRFLPVAIRFEQEPDRDVWRVTVEA